MRKLQFTLAVLIVAVYLHGILLIKVCIVSLDSTGSHDDAEVGPLLDQAMASFAGDGRHDREGVAAAVAGRHPAAEIVVPPCPAAVPSEVAKAAPTRCDRYLQHVEPSGSPGATEHGEAATGKLKQVIGDGLRSRTDRRRAAEVDGAVHALNRMLELGCPILVRIA